MKSIFTTAFLFLSFFFCPAQDNETMGAEAIIYIPASYPSPVRVVPSFPGVTKGLSLRINDARTSYPYVRALHYQTPSASQRKVRRLVQRTPYEFKYRKLSPALIQSEKLFKF